MDIKPLSRSDLTYLPDVLPPGWEPALPAIQLYTTLDFCFPIKVALDNKIIGTGTVILHNDVAWLAHIIVHPEYRNQGIGQTITKALIEIAKSKECDTLYLLATELGEPVYRKIGFETETEYLFFKAEGPIDSGNNDECIVQYSSEYEKEIALIDQQVSSEDRMFHLQQHLANGFIYVVDDNVEGYYLPTMGDGLIIARSSTAGQALMKLRLRTKDFAVFPIDNLNAVSLIHQHPFEEIRRQKRMRLGKERKWRPSNIYNRTGGNLG